MATLVKNPAANARDLRGAGSVSESGRCPGGGHGHPLLYSCLENPVDRGAWRPIVHGVSQSWTRLKQPSRGGFKFKFSGFRFHCFPYIVMEEAMAPHSSTLAWKIPWTEEPGGLQSMGSWRVRHDWATSLSLVTFMHWRRKWQPTPVFLPGESQGWRSLVGCRLWGHTELDTTEET